MKKFYLVLLISILFSSCGGDKNRNNQSGGATSDMEQTMQQESPVAGTEAYFLTSDSIGPVRVGTPISNLPVAVPNLYDHMLVTPTTDAMAYMFMLGDTPQFMVYDFMEGNVDVIALEDNSRAVHTSEGALRCGDSFKKVLALNGVESEWMGFEEEGGIWYWKWNGLYFTIDETEISEALGDAMCDSHRPPRASMFDDSVTIGYIGTGLPF